MERAMRFELTTPTLARLCSTPELRPRTVFRKPRDNTQQSGLCNPSFTLFFLSAHMVPASSTHGVIFSHKSRPIMTGFDH